MTRGVAIARCFDGLNEEAFRCRSIPFRCQQKLDHLASGVDRTVQVRLDPPPNAAGIHRKAPLGQHLSHVLVRERIL
jgi:hypothetical protein